MSRLKEFNQFRLYCLKNAEDALSSAELIQANKVNHIAYHLAVLALEEVGKVFVGWTYFSSEQDKISTIAQGIDDHIKKLYWAIWGPIFTTEKITQQLVDELKHLASSIHKRRLESLYTGFEDKANSFEKIPDEELKALLDFTRTRLDGEKKEGQVRTSISKKDEKELDAFAQMTEDPKKKPFVFSTVANDKLVELGSMRAWVKWLIEKFDNEAKESMRLINQEIGRSVSLKKKPEPKWKIKYKLDSPLYSIRANLLNKFNEKSAMIKLSMGKDNHTLVVEVNLESHVHIKELWHAGYIYAKLYAASINIAARGFFWWHTSRDIGKYYDKVYDVELKKEVGIELVTKLEWPKTKAVLNEQQLYLSLMAFRFLTNNFDQPIFGPLNDYLMGLTMVAKNDIHLRMENGAFRAFSRAFHGLLTMTSPGNADLREFGYTEISGLLTDKENYYKIFDLGELARKSKKITVQITLTEVISIKILCDCYLLTLAAREQMGDPALQLSGMDDIDSNN